MEVYNCRTLEDAKKFLLSLHLKGITWATGISLLKENYWYKYEESTCYRIDGDDTLRYGNKQYYAEDTDYSIVVYHGPLAIADLLSERQSK